MNMGKQNTCGKWHGHSSFISTVNCIFPVSQKFAEDVSALREFRELLPFFLFVCLFFELIGFLFTHLPSLNGRENPLSTLQL